MTKLDQVIHAALKYQIAEMSEPHVNFDADLEYAEDMLKQAIREFVESEYTVSISLD